LSGEDWLRTVPSHADIVRQLEKEADYHRASTFVVRSFLYLAYADVYEVVFTPDSVRAKPLGTIIKQRRAFQSPQRCNLPLEWLSLFH
jgi:hypothetical protein